jgi:hypothetical protein
VVDRHFGTMPAIRMAIDCEECRASVIPAQAGIQFIKIDLGPGFRRGDE